MLTYALSKSSFIQKLASNKKASAFILSSTLNKKVWKFKL